MRAIALASALALAGCVLVTGGTDGYERAAPDAGAGEPRGLTLGCVSSKDCAAEGGAAICCLVVSSTTTASSTCQPAPCGGLLPMQLCAEDAECSGVPCTLQGCPYNGTTITVRACGTSVGCAPR